ncbi:MAG: hypothetical protein IJW05_06575 [Lentisphaeria bacterium]|nr:hypothetical protein [Lentisphaeria bacterium]
MKKRFLAYRSFYPEVDTMKEFSDAGVDTFSVMISNCLNALGTPYTKYPPVWTGKDQYDLDAADAAFEDILRKIPEAKFICFVDLNTPLWWARYLGAYGARHDSYYELGRIAGSTLWRQDTLKYMKVLLSHLTEKYGSRIVSYAFGCGGGTEWHDRCRGAESLFRLNGFRNWCKGNGKPWNDIPSMGRREKGLREFSVKGKYDTTGYWAGYDDSEVDPLIREDAGGLFYDPEQQADVIDYWKFCNELIADTIDFFLKEARKIVLPEVELGAVYGYITTEGQYMLSSNGHMEYERLLQSDAIDYLLAPATDRAIGGGSGSLCVVGTIHARGKQMFNSADNETWTSKGPDGGTFPPDWVAMHNETELESSIKRELALNLVEGTSLWFFDKWGGSYSPECIRTIGSIRNLWEEESKHPPVSKAETLIVVDPENVYYINNMHPNSNNFHLPWKLNMNRSGAPFRFVSFNDLEMLDLTGIKAVILCHPFELDLRKKTILKERVMKENRLVIWSYGPGIINEGKWDESNVEKICGVPFGTSGLALQQMEGWRSLYVHDPRVITPEKMREILRSAGVWIYSSVPCPVYVNERMLGIHIGKAEEIDITLPETYAKISEVFTGEEVENTDHISFKTNGTETRLYRLKKEER